MLGGHARTGRACFHALLELGPLTRLQLRRAPGAGVPARPCTARSRRARALRPRRRPRARPRDLHHHLGPGRRQAAARSSSTSTTSGGSRANCGRSLRSGGVFYGGLILGAAGRPSGTSASTGSRSGRWPTPSRPRIALGHVVGRFGCLLAGCCYGKPTTLPWGITFTRSRSPPATSARRCTWRCTRRSCYDAGGRVPHPRAPRSATERLGGGTPDGRSGSTSCVYGISRFAIEFFRGDPRGVDMRLLDVAVDLDGAGAAVAGDAVVLSRSGPLRAGG
ncbi:MAG: prolipoprotein diacylglyceryl transferase [Candidatus Moduliflexus flocculans]|nr:prolipoprotein diacylglyceryl transferase [Candidatus Moduliflexus flocculans]